MPVYTWFPEFSCYLLIMMRIKDDAKGKRDLEKLLQPARDRKVDESIAEIPNAAEVIAGLQKQIDRLKKQVKYLEKRTDKLWKAHIETGGRRYEDEAR